MQQSSVLTSRKSSSTPSLSDVSESQASVASTEQAASAENLTAAVKAVSITILTIELNLLLLTRYVHFLLTSHIHVKLSQAFSGGVCLLFSDG